ncbi:MAG: hypothetical protein V8S22_07430 [Lachnospiraceae bacterium]
MPIKKEDTLFVKSAYLKALLDLDYEEELPYLKERLQELDQEPVTEANQKHIREEAGMLSAADLSEKRNGKNSTFDGSDWQVEVILLDQPGTERSHKKSAQRRKSNHAGRRHAFLYL